MCLEASGPSERRTRNSELGNTDQRCGRVGLECLGANLGWFGQVRAGQGRKTTGGPKKAKAVRGEWVTGGGSAPRATFTASLTGTAWALPHLKMDREQTPFGGKCGCFGRAGRPDLRAARALRLVFPPEVLRGSSKCRRGPLGQRLEAVTRVSGGRGGVCEPSLHAAFDSRQGLTQRLFFFCSPL